MILKSGRSFFALAATVLVLALGCQKSDPGAGNVSQKDVKEVASILADTVGGMGTAVAKSATPLPPNVVFTREDIPNEGGYLQVSIGEVTDAQANSFLRRLKSETCTCGCPHTIDQCLLEDPQCTTAHQLAAQVLKEVTGGL
jgi:ATP-dependent helicase YprA (DUF1998 family)